MAKRQPSPVTELLIAAGQGDLDARNKLWDLIYNELRGIARQQMAKEAPGHTLQPTALVHEAFFRLFGNDNVQWANRAHFFAAAAEAMRRIRIDDARTRKRLKRGGGQRPVGFTDEVAVFDQNPTEVLGVGEALEELERLAPRKAQVVKLRYFAGLKINECAAALGVSRRTVDKEWRLARAWLHRKLTKCDTADRDSMDK